MPHFQQHGVTVAKIASYSSRSFNEEDVLWRGQTAGSKPLGMTISARRAVEQAREIANSPARNPPLDIRRLTAPYPVLRDSHEKDFQ